MSESYKDYSQKFLKELEDFAPGSTRDVNISPNDSDAEIHSKLQQASRHADAMANNERAQESERRNLESSISTYAKSIEVGEHSAVIHNSDGTTRVVPSSSLSKINIPSRIKVGKA
jgi:hypothetical protein